MRPHKPPRIGRHARKQADQHKRENGLAKAHLLLSESISKD